jgi:hypothetical protein
MDEYTEKLIVQVLISTTKLPLISGKITDSIGDEIGAKKQTIQCTLHT